MTPEQYLALAKEHVAAERYHAATAYAGLAAAAIVAGLHAVLPPPLHRGDHTPQKLEWCGRCRSPRRRYISSEHGSARPCPRCNGRKLEKLRVRPCHHCGVDLEENDDGQWVDAAGRIGCPRAPDPNVPPTATDEPDLNRDEEWAEFLTVLAQEREAFTTADLRDNLRQWGGYLPRTRFGTFPSTVQLQAWMQARAGKPLAGHVLKREPNDEHGVVRWRVDTVKEPIAALD